MHKQTDHHRVGTMLKIDVGTEEAFVEKRRMHCALSPSSASASPRSVAQRLKESTLKDSPVPSTSSAKSPKALSQGASLPRRPLSRYQQNTIKVIAQFLRDLGLHESVETLVEESGCKVENTHAVRLREAIMHGNWNEAMLVLDNSYPILNETQIEGAKIVILEEKLYDLLSKHERGLAIKLLQEEFPSSKVHRTRLAKLISLVFTEVEELAINPDISKHFSRSSSCEPWRKHLMRRLQKELPCHYMLPPRRLERLTMQAYKYQIGHCGLHFEGNDTVHEPIPDTVVRDHRCIKKHKPMFKARQIVKKHMSEIWSMEFSPDGQKLAAGSKDGELFIFSVDAHKRTLSHFAQYKRPDCASIMCIAWSYDSQYLAIGGSEKSEEAHAVIFQVSKGFQPLGKIKPVQTNPNNCFTAVTYFNCKSKKIVAGNLHGNLQLFEMGRNGLKHISGFEGFRVNWIYGCKDGRTVIAADTHNRVRTYDFIDLTDETLLQEEHAITHFAVHSTERYLLLCTRVYGLRLWDLETGTLLRTLNGVGFDSQCVQATLGGPSDTYACAGSKDGSISVWHLNKAKPVGRLESPHRGFVGVVRWSPADTCLLVSAGDDRQIRIFEVNQIDEFFDPTPFNISYDNGLDNGNSRAYTHMDGARLVKNGVSRTSISSHNSEAISETP